MLKRVCFLWLLVLSVSLNAQVLPKDGSILNYRIIGFSFPSLTTAQKTGTHKIEIADGNYNDTSSFKRNIIIAKSCKDSRMIVEVPSFGRQYTWRMVYDDKTSGIQNNELYHFSTGTIESIDTTLMRLRIVKHAKKYKDSFVFVDASRILYDMNGEPVWFLPDLDDSNYNRSVEIRDMQLSPFGTITLLAGDNAYEINYEGKILWKGIHNSKLGSYNPEHYHHEFTHLANGHYMVLHDEITTDTGSVSLGSIEEYDKKGSRVWSWKSSSYYKQMWLQHEDTLASEYVNTSANAFFFDEQKKMLYVSFKNINQILKIKYPEGKVLNTYGKTGMPSSLFGMQHACKISQQGYLYMLNNLSQPTGHPRIMMMNVSSLQKCNFKTIWQYDYPVIDTYKKRFTGPLGPKLTIGGNVTELPDRALFASLCTPYNNIFIIDRSKKILWEAACEKRTSSKDKWVTAPTYRASIVKNSKELERLICKSEY